MKIVTIGLFLILSQIASSAENSEMLKFRYKVFENMQTMCKINALSGFEVASAIVKASRQSLSSLCECTALLIVSQKTDAELESFALGDDKLAVRMNQEVGNVFRQCVDLKDPL